METVTDFIFLGSKITAGGDCSHEIKRHLLLERKATTNIDNVLEKRVITLGLIFPSIRVFSSESALHIRWPKYWRFRVSISSSNQYSGFIPLGLTGLISLQAKGLPRVFSSNIVWKHQFFGAQPFLCPTFTYVHGYWKNHHFALGTFVSKVMSLFLNTLSRFVITFLPRSKSLLSSWL